MLPDSLETRVASDKPLGRFLERLFMSKELARAIPGFSTFERFAIARLLKP